MQRNGWQPNTISLLSVVMAAAASACMLLAAWPGGTPAVVGLLVAPVFVALRGLCNLLDGLVAVEGNLRTASGELFNDLPDRVSDLLLYVAAGHAVIGSAWGVELGWAAAALAIMTAYVRYLGGAMRAGQSFLGPMAKTHRMACLSAGCVAAAVEFGVRGSTLSLLVSLAAIAIGCVITIARRAMRIHRVLEAR